MSHANALLTPLGRLLLARFFVDDGWPLRHAADRFIVSVTASKTVGRPVQRILPRRAANTLAVTIAASTNAMSALGGRTGFCSDGRAMGPAFRPRMRCLTSVVCARRRDN